MKSFWVTFYSYKGGVGRSTALANVAAILASQGRRVLMVDFDLEAPGLDSFEEFALEPNAAGMVEYVSKYIDTKRAPAVDAYVHEIQLPEMVSGKLWLLPAGKKDAAYNRQRSAINWSEFYKSQSGALFFENFKADIEDRYQPDYVLIDSRTGLTDVGGICTAHLPDLVVLLFALNEQNLKGIASVARVLEKSDRAPQLIPVATPVPNLPRDSKSLIDERFERAKELLGVDLKLAINYSAQVSLREKVYAWGDTTPLSFQYRELKDAIAEANPEGLDYLIRQAKEAVEAFDLERGQEIATTLKEQYADRSDTWLWLAELRKLHGDIEGYKGALQKALEVDPNNEDAFSRLYTFLKTKREFTVLTALMESLLARDGCLKSAIRNHLRQHLGELYLHLKQADKAYHYYKAYFESVEDKLKGNSNKMGLLCAQFNLIESARRASIPSPVAWTSVIENYESSLTNLNSENLAIRLNRLQAMHIPYACCGKIDRATELLNEVDKMVKQVSPQERLFSVVEYDNVPRDIFIAQNKMMIEALKLNQLWDGQPLPV